MNQSVRRSPVSGHQNDDPSLVSLDSESTPGRPSGLRLLSLDGGGVRGLSTLYILKCLMAQLNHKRKIDGCPAVRPCDVFDLIGGTSTGGLIAIMLGRLKMDIDDCIDAYVELVKDVFGERSHSAPITLSGRLQSRFDSKKLKGAIEQVLCKHNIPLKTPFVEQGSTGACKVFVCAVSKELYSIARLRSYKRPGLLDTASGTICESALATSAATNFFDPVSIGERQFVDGAMGANNPVFEVASEAKDIFDKAQFQSRVKCFVSIGTGNPGMREVDYRADNFLRTLKEIMTETEQTAAKFLDQWEEAYDQKRYFRFNVDQGLQGVGLEEYKALGAIEAATDVYLSGTVQKGQIRQCVETLNQKDRAHDRQGPCLKDSRLEEAIRSSGVYTQFNTRFIGRSKVLHDIYSKFWGPSNSVGGDSVNVREHPLNIVERVAVHGLKGMGKTCLAFEYARRWKDLYDDIWFVSAKDVVSFETDMNKIPGFRRKGEFTQWLEEQVHRRRWLLVVDDVVEETMKYARMLPSSRSRQEHDGVGIGHLIYTTYLDTVATDHLTQKNAVELDYFDARDAEALFLSVCGSDPARRWDPEVLAMLPKYPTSINLIATAVCRNKLDRARLSNILKDPGQQIIYLKDDPKAGVIVKLIEMELSEKDRQFLAILSNLHTTSFHLGLLQECLRDTADARNDRPVSYPRRWWRRCWRSQKRQYQLRDLEIEESRLDLRKILPETSTATLDIEAKRYSALPLMRRNGLQVAIPDIFQYLIRQLVTKKSVELERKFFTLSLVLAIEIGEKSPWLNNDSSLAESFVSLMGSLTTHAVHASKSWQHSSLAMLNFHAADYLYSRLRTLTGLKFYDAGMMHWNKARPVSQAKETAYELGFIENYALALMEERRFEDAEPYFERAYEGLKRVEGKNSQATIRARANLMHFKQAQGLSKEAARGFEDMMAEYEELARQGEIAPEDWYNICISHAMCLKDQGQYTHSMSKLQDVLRNLVSPPSNSSGTARSILIHGLVQIVGLLSMNLGHHSEADKIFQCITDKPAQISVLAALVNIPFEEGCDRGVVASGAELTETVFCANLCLGASLVEQERYDEAAKQFDKTLSTMDNGIDLDVLDPSLYDANRLLILEGIAICQVYLGSYAEAEKNFAIICGKYSQHTGQDWLPQEALRAKEGLAMAKGMQRKPEAMEEFRVVVGLTEKHLGSEHPDIFTTFHRMATVLQQQGDIKGSEYWYKKALEGRMRTLGHKHLLTRQSEGRLEALGKDITL